MATLQYSNEISYQRFNFVWNHQWGILFKQYSSLIYHITLKGYLMKIEEINFKPQIGMVYLDLDGVIIWLTKGIAEYNNVTTKEVEESGWDNHYWNNVLQTADIEKFFANLDWAPNGKNLINWFTQRNINVTFLTRPTREPSAEACIRGKKIWLEKQGVGNIPVIFERAKEKYATSGEMVNILIDDHSGNINLWIQKSGIGIHYCDSWFPDVIKKLESIFGDK